MPATSAMIRAAVRESRKRLAIDRTAYGSAAQRSSSERQSNRSGVGNLTDLRLRFVRIVFICLNFSMARVRLQSARAVPFEAPATGDELRGRG